MFFTKVGNKSNKLSNSEEKILGSIDIASENNPRRPEFPPDKPKFPATPTYKINVPGFTNVFLKDESYNPTGTHKDRLAWEIVVTYRYFLESKRDGRITGDLPKMSIITSGNAGVAIQNMLKKYGLPNLKVLVDRNIDKDRLNKLSSFGCEVYITDLSRKVLDWPDILELTENKNGFDITSSEALDPTTRFYDWLSYETINSNPSYCFMPFGTGNLFENVLNINKKEITSSTHDPRFRGNTEVLKKCNFIGATTDDPNSKSAVSLFSPHLPFSHYNEQWIRLYRSAGYCGPRSDVKIIEENFLDEAIVIAEEQNISAEPSALAGLALMLQMRDSLPKDEKILILSTGKADFGAGKKDETHR